MLSRVARLAVATALIAPFPQFANLDEASKLRVLRRAERARGGIGSGGGQPMSMASLQQWARQRRRARQTHPGKRR